MENSKNIAQLKEAIDKKIDELAKLQEEMLKACNSPIFVAISVIESTNCHNVAIELRGMLNYLNMRNALHNIPPIVYSVHSEILPETKKHS